jgi:DNA-binding HxlR family transcriptional regulator
VTEKTEFPKSIKEVITKKYKGVIVKDLSFDTAEKDFSLLAKQISQSNAS